MLEKLLKAHHRYLYREGSYSFVQPPTAGKVSLSKKGKSYDDKEGSRQRQFWPAKLSEMASGFDNGKGDAEAVRLVDEEIGE